MKQLAPHYQAFIDRAKELMDTGGGRLTITGARYARSVARNLVGGAAAEQGFITRVVKDSESELLVDIIMDLDWGGRRPRGAPKSQVRVDIENLQPGAWANFTIDEDLSAEKLRGTIQSVRRATGREFMTRRNECTVVVTRTDRLHEASEDLRKATEAEIARGHSKWPFGILKIDESYLIKDGNIESARSMAQYQKRRYGKAFSVSKTADGVIITRNL